MAPTRDVTGSLPDMTGRSRDADPDARRRRLNERQRDDVSVSEQPRRARFSRLDPTNWPSGTGTVLFVAWLAYAFASTVWVHLLLWTVLPSGLTLFLFAERYPWRGVLIFVVPLTLLTAFSQVVAISSEAPTWVAFAIYLIACGYFSFVVCYPNRDGWIARLPRWLLGERFAARLAWARFEDSVVAANAVVRQISASDDQGGRQAAIHRLALEARRESRRGGTWREAWAAHAAWLEGLGELVGIEPCADQVRHVNDRLAEADGAQMLAIERTAVVDPAGR